MKKSALITFVMLAFLLFSAAIMSCEPKCYNDDECGDNLCRKGVCVWGTTCFGSECFVAPGAYCERSKRCSLKEHCDRVNMKCLKEKQCTKDGDCVGFEVCRLGLCLDTFKCGGKRCASGLEECNPRTRKCERIPQCKKDEDCPRNFACGNGYCDLGLPCGEDLCNLRSERCIEKTKTCVSLR